MSIAALTQVYDEMRRLAIAGSVTAGGDFRLKKLLPPLVQAGSKAPVFAKVAEAVKAVVDGNEQSSATALLDLTTLVNAILYTQGETGAPGTLEPIETTDLGAGSAQVSARVLKPLLEALTSTGAGRLELIRDAHERGAFRDLRLVKPALEALDDAYGEIADFIADKVLPLYGKAIVPALRSRLDLKGRAGHARRLRLLHAFDPAGTRELVKQALDAGSKEVKVVAIECLGAEPEDLSYLLEQASAKAQEVRQAAYHALATMRDDTAVTALQKALSGKDLDLAADSVRQSRNPKLLSFVIAEADQEIAGLLKTKDKKDAGKKIARIQSLARCLAGQDDKESEAFFLRIFGQGGDLAKVKGDTMSGVDLNATVVGLMGEGTKKLRTVLAEAHGSLSADELGVAFHAARHALPAAKVFEMFSPYLTAKVDEKKKQRDPAWAKREAVCAAIAGQYHYWSSRDDSGPPLDPRWLDVAVDAKHLGLVRQLGRPGHATANAFLQQTFDAVLKKSKSLDECHEVVASMVLAGHPQATEAFIAAFERHAKKSNYYAYWFARLIPDLPKSAVPKLEALLPSLEDKVADSLLDCIQELRDKK